MNWRTTGLVFAFVFVALALCWSKQEYGNFSFSSTLSTQLIGDAPWCASQAEDRTLFCRYYSERQCERIWAPDNRVWFCVPSTSGSSGSSVDDPWKALTVGVALLATLVAMRQWQLAREKLRLDLFEKRYCVFDAVRKFIASIVTSGQVSVEEQRLFWAGTGDTTFLFERDVREYVDLIHREACKLHSHTQMQKAVHLSDGDRELHIKRVTELSIWFASQLHDEKMPALFMRYLSFQDLQSPFSSLIRRLTSRSESTSLIDATGR